MKKLIAGFVLGISTAVLVMLIDEHIRDRFNKDIYEDIEGYLDL